MNKHSHLPPEQALRDLIEAIRCAERYEPRLEVRLREICAWVSDLKPGEIVSKKYLLLFLTELVTDAQQWLLLKEAKVEIGQDFFNELLVELNPTERYWITVCFPAWFTERDPKFQRWKHKLKSNRFQPEDAQIIDKLCRAVEWQGGYTITRLLADLSMSTDLVACGSASRGLCVQCTRTGGQHLREKFIRWRQDLQEHWKIERGLLVSFLPMGQSWEHTVAHKVLNLCDELQNEDYKMEEIL